MPEMRSSEDEHRGEISQEELDAARHQLSAYRELMEEVPRIYEQKFRERLEPLHAHNQQLLEEGRLLEEELARMPPPRGDAPVPGALPPAQERERSQPPSPRARRPWLVFGSLAALLLVGGGFLQVLRQSRSTLAPPTTRTRPVAKAPAKVLPAGEAPVAEPARATPGELRLKTRGVSWMEVRTLSGTTLLMGNLQGERSFPLDRGLRISAGRPDLVTVERHSEPARTLGGIREIGWHTFEPTTPAEERASKRERPQPRP
jgi:hypothetical protein